MLAQYPRPVLTAVGLTMGGPLAFYTFAAYAQKFLVNTTGFSKEQATRISFGASGVGPPFAPAVAIFGGAA